MREEQHPTTHEQGEADAHAETRHRAFTRAELKHEARRQKAKARQQRHWTKAAEMVRRQGATRTAPPATTPPPSFSEIYARLFGGAE